MMYLFICWLSGACWPEWAGAGQGQDQGQGGIHWPGKFTAENKDKDRREGKGRRCCLGGTELIQFLAVLAILQQDDLKKG